MRLSEYKMEYWPNRKGFSLFKKHNTYQDAIDFGQSIDGMIRLRIPPTHTSKKKENEK